MAGCKLVFHHMKLSQPVRAIQMLLDANNIEHEKNVIDLMTGQHKSEEYLKVNPFGAVPAITHGDFNLNESVAILKYLCGAYKVPDNWYPADLKKRAKVDLYLAWQHVAIRQNGVIIFLSEALGKVFGSEPYGKEEKVAQAKIDFEKSLNQLATIFLKDTPFLFANDITIADLLCVSELMQPMAIGYDIKGNHPKVMEYILRVRDRLGPKPFDRVQRVVYEITKRDYFV